MLDSPVTKGTYPRPFAAAAAALKKMLLQLISSLKQTDIHLQ